MQRIQLVLSYRVHGNKIEDYTRLAEKGIRSEAGSLALCVIRV